MGGERASTTRMREQGRTCCLCQIPLKPPPAKERYCGKCAPKHQVYMHYMTTKDGWRCSFLEADLKTSLPRKLTFANHEKIRELAERGNAFKSLADRQAMDHGIEKGRGGIHLSLTVEQYRKLCQA